ncbi:MarR family winged helix-turn-helix transcriptional regulator [Curtobacterium ammoniigenes]|uniref:MarR family winged helix-turn-helix transcriptional regulator n=1 Tax=Curtobacterium ammoniigenes TaxID=395387 RepID=UPI000829E874|nr:MarR family transcriptional regulator [Curtobacterium ammoniigenes]
MATHHDGGVDSGLEEVVGASRGLLGVVARSLAPALEDVTVPQLRLIVLAATLGPTRSRDLAERLGVSTSTFTRNVDRLEAGGWVHRRINEESKREVFVEATRQGRELVDDVTARRRAELKTLLDSMPPEDREAAVLGASAMRRALDEPLPEELSRFGG